MTVSAITTSMFRVGFNCLLRHAGIAELHFTPLFGFEKKRTQVDPQTDGPSFPGSSVAAAGADAAILRHGPDYVHTLLADLTNSLKIRQIESLDRIRGKMNWARAE